MYCSLYRWDGTRMRREWDYLALPPDALAGRLAEPTILLGDAALAVPSPHARPAPPPRRLPSPATVGRLGLLRLAAGQAVPAAELVPLYLRPSEAELKRRAALVR